MSDQIKKRNVILRHPFLIGFLAIGFGFIALSAFAPRIEHKALDYSKPILTEDHAIICPQSLFFDIRASHDSNAIFEAFTAFSRRDEKAAALGCEVVTGDLPVVAHRMSSPFDNYVSVKFSALGIGEFFTMEGNLKNGPSVLETLKPAHPAPGPDYETIPDTPPIAPTKDDVPNPSVEIVRSPPNAEVQNNAHANDSPQEPSTDQQRMQFSWKLQLNGDEVLDGPSGSCATLALQSAHDPNRLHVIFNDGSTKIYPVDQTTDAMQAAYNYCRAK